MKITVLIENSALDGFECEHGLSLLIEFNNNKYLLDAGQSGKIINNAYIMGINLSKIKCAVLSHGHYDHAGGFEKFLEENPKTRIYAMKNVTGEFYSESGGMHYIGIPEIIKDKYGDNFIYTDGIVSVDTDVYLVPHSTAGLEKIGKRAGLYMKCDGEMMPDDFSHELSLVFNTENGLVIFNSCSHAGMRNIIEEVKSFFPERKVYAFVGGLHMKGMKDGKEYCTFSENELDELVKYVLNEGIERIYTGHCTGNVGTEILMKKTESVNKLTTGMEIII